MAGSERGSEVRTPRSVIVMVVDRSEPFAPDDVVGGVDGAIEVEIAIRRQRREAKWF